MTERIDLGKVFIRPAAPDLGVVGEGARPGDPATLTSFGITTGGMYEAGYREVGTIVGDGPVMAVLDEADISITAHRWMQGDEEPQVRPHGDHSPGGGKPQVKPTGNDLPDGGKA